jgi:glutaredoxin
MYTRPGCHLCDEMKETIRAAGCAQLYVLEEIDIESDPELLTRYQHEIPVLCINGVEAFRHRVRADEFEAYVTSLLNRRL